MKLDQDKEMKFDKDKEMKLDRSAGQKTPAAADLKRPLLERAMTLLETTDIATTTLQRHRTESSKNKSLSEVDDFSGIWRFLTRTPPIISLSVALIAFSFSIKAAVECSPAPAFIFQSVLIGCAVYTFFEYSIHRFGLHVIPLLLGGRDLFRFAHGRHHIFFFPQEASRIVFPLTHIVIFLVPPMLLYLYAFGYERGWIIVSTNIICHICNEIIHVYAHGQFGRHRVLEASRFYHLQHHLASSQTAFGFCTPWWDFALGTLPRAFTSGGGASWQLRIITALPIPVPFVHWVLLGLLTPELYLHPVMAKAYAPSPPTPQQKPSFEKSATTKDLSVGGEHNDNYLLCSARGAVTLSQRESSLLNNCGLEELKKSLSELVSQVTGASSSSVTIDDTATKATTSSSTDVISEMTQLVFCLPLPILLMIYYFV